VRILVTGAAGFICGNLAPADSAHEGGLDARSASASHPGGNPSARLMRVAGISTDVNMSAGGHTRNSPAPGRMRGPSDVCITGASEGPRIGRLRQRPALFSRSMTLVAFPELEPPWNALGRGIRI
jgi:hypothetical protein